MSQSNVQSSSCYYCVYIDVCRDIMYGFFLKQHDGCQPDADTKFKGQPLKPANVNLRNILIKSYSRCEAWLLWSITFFAIPHLSRVTSFESKLFDG